MQKQIDWNYYLYFLKVAETGNLNHAATELGVNHSTVFRRINSLENILHVRLFERSKSGYALTRAGEEILGRVRLVDEQMFSIQRTLLGKDDRLSGHLKISTTDTLGYYWLPIYIKRFKERYPEILIDLDIQIRFTDLTKREADIVISAVNMQPDYMVGRQLSPIYFRLYASRTYIDRHGMPGSTEDFSNHQFLVPNEALSTISAGKWLREHIDEKNIAAASDKLSTLYKFAQQDLGIAPLPHYVGGGDDRLVEILELPEYCHRQVWILTHPDLRNTARIRTFMQFMYHQTRQSSQV